MPELLSYLKRQDLVEKFVTYADKNGLQRRNLMVAKSRHLLEKYLYSRIIYNMLDEQAWMEYLNEDDPDVRKGKKVFADGLSWPKLTDKDKKK